MKTETALALIDKARPTKENLEKIRAKLEKAYGPIDNWKYLVDRAFCEFESAVAICSR